MADTATTFRESLVALGGRLGSHFGREVVADFGDVDGEHRALTTDVAVVDRTDRTQIELWGPDSRAFLHNLCTNEIRRLELQRGCEAFLCDAQGRIVGHIFVYARPEALVVESVAGQAETLLAHMDRYLIREQVELIDRTTTWAQLMLAGPQAGTLLQSMGVEQPDTAMGSHGATKIAGHDVWIRRIADVSPDALAIVCSQENTQAVWRCLTDAGARPAGATVAEMARIEAGLPEFGVDIPPKTLPQEVARDEQTISFVKGCYIGQETVARIDALGHVNKLLRGVQFAGSTVPAAGTVLLGDDKEVGRVTSAAQSPRLDAPLALAYVRRGNDAEGTTLDCEYGQATVVRLPI